MISQFRFRYDSRDSLKIKDIQIEPKFNSIFVSFLIAIRRKIQSDWRPLGVTNQPTSLSEPLSQGCQRFAQIFEQEFRKFEENRILTWNLSGDRFDFSSTYGTLEVSQI